jgi:predicted nucleic acid-binding protein
MLPGLAHSTPSREFCERLAARRGRVYFSQLLRLELVETLKNLVVRRPAQLPTSVRRQHRLDDWEADARVRRRWMTFGVNQFRAFLRQFEDAIELPLDEETWERSIEIMIRHKIRSYDAMHVATARAHGLRHLATVDRWFSGIRSPRIWLTRDSSP